ncbi:MAG: sigma factor, partial [Planctomycetota bacterium]
MEAAIDEHRDWLRSVIAARLGEPQAVDEVMQEVSMAVVANRAPLENQAKLAPWLYQIAVRQTLLYRRKHGRRRNLIHRYAERTQPQETDTRTPSPL